MAPSKNTEESFDQGYAQMMGENIDSPQSVDKIDAQEQDTIETTLRGLNLKTKIITSYEI